MASLKGRIRRHLLEPATLALARPMAAALNRFVQGNGGDEVFGRHGFHLLRKHYYLPIPDETDFKTVERLGNSAMVGVDLNEAAALDMLDRVFPPFVREFDERFPVDEPAGPSGPDPPEFYLINGRFMAVDAHVYYALVRHGKPSRVVEIGSGFSTRVAAEACLKNEQEGRPCRLTAIEPYPGLALEEGFPGLAELVRSRVQDVDMDVFTTLGPGDVLFIDSTHALRQGGDVHIEYCEILPRLAPGVLVHVHDISLPKAYPDAYRTMRLYWNEQYVLQAFLTYNSRFEVIWPGNALMTNHPDRLTAAFPGIAAMRRKYPQSEPSSLWMRVRPDAPPGP